MLESKTFYAEGVKIAGFDFDAKTLEKLISTHKMTEVEEVCTFLSRPDVPKGTWWLPREKGCVMRSAMAAG